MASSHALAALRAPRSVGGARAWRAARRVRPGAGRRADAADRVRALCRPQPVPAWPRQARDVQLPRLHAHLREDQEGVLQTQARHGQEADAGQGGRRQRRRVATHASAGPRSAAVVRSVLGALQLLRRPDNSAALAAFRYEVGRALAANATPAQPAFAHDLGAVRATCRRLATTCPRPASLAPGALRRHYPRREPSELRLTLGLSGGPPETRVDHVANGRRAVPSATTRRGAPTTVRGRLHEALPSPTRDASVGKRWTAASLSHSSESRAMKGCSWSHRRGRRAAGSTRASS
jgi:hypothetical protein